MEIGFHIPDILNHHRLNIILYETIKKNPECFRDNVKIASVYGVFPGAMWNGGRFLGGPLSDERTMRLCIEDYNSRGIPVRYTFTNPLVKKEHFGNHYCNMMLRAANNGMNEVIVFSQELEDYIRENYPKFKITSSTCKEIRTPEGVDAELQKDYNLIVLDYNWNNNFEFLEKIKEKNRCEILVNACCIPNCPRRGKHYQTIGAQQISFAEQLAHGVKEIKLVDDLHCEYACQNFYKTIGYSTHITPDAIYEKYAPMGFSHFKIEGRTNTDVSVLENFVYYMVKPEYQNLIRLDMLQWLTDRIKCFA